VETSTTGIFQLKDKRFKDLYIPPLAFLPDIPIEALVLKIEPAYSDLALFFEGYCLGTKQLGMPMGKGREFFEWTFDYYTAPPFELGDRVAATLEKGRPIVGKIVDIRYEEIEVQEETSSDVMVLLNKLPCRIKRDIRVGDTVKVHWPSSLNHRRKGWALQIQGVTVDILDADNKEEVSGIIFATYLVKTLQFSCYRWQLRFNDLTDEPDEFSTVVSHAEREDRRANKEMRGYDRLNELVNVKVIIVGDHPDKGLRGRVRMHTGKKLMRVELESGARMVDVHINHLLSR
jgi:hypothetical protein